MEVVEEPVTERVAAFDECAPRLRTADTVDAHAPLGLEVAHALLGLRAVVAVDDDRHAGGVQTLLDVADRVASVPASEQRPCHQSRVWGRGLIRRCTRPAPRGAAPCPWHRPDA